LGYWILNDVVWIKSNPMPNFRGVRFTNAQETLIWAQKIRGARYTFNHQAMKALNGDLQMRSDWRIPLCSGKERLKVNGAKAHSTQKPEALLYRVILSSSDPGDVVLDPFFGTGTTGVVARRLHRRWIGIEREPFYVALAKQRIAAEQPGEYRQEVYRFDRRREQRRMPLGSLLEQGLLKPGQSLYLDGRQELEAVVLANGQLRCNGVSGSIHQVARALLGEPCNGWDRWWVHETRSGELVVLDRLRQEAQQNLDA
jgi:modification methylase